MQRQTKQSKVYKNEIAQIPICKDKEIKVKSTELKYCRCHNAETS